MKFTPDQIDTYRNKYKVLHSTCYHIEKTIMGIIEDLVKGHEEMFITSRTKTEDSFIAKITRDDKDYSDPFTEITDVIGVRIIVQYKDDAESIGAVLKKALIIDKQNSRDTRDQASVSIFGYSAIHLVASLPLGMIEEKKLHTFGERKFEIQIRTNLEHAWASKSRELSYNKSLQNKYQRQLNRLSALLEVADADFVALKKKISRPPRKTPPHKVKEVSQITPQEIVNILDNSEPINGIVKSLADHGLKVIDSSRLDFASGILDILTRNNVKTSDQATTYIEKNIGKIVMACKLYMEAGSNKAFRKDSLLVAALAIVSNPGTTPEEYSEGWDSFAKSNFRKAANEYKQT